MVERTAFACAAHGMVEEAVGGIDGCGMFGILHRCAVQNDSLVRGRREMGGVGCEEGWSAAAINVTLTKDT